MVHILGEKATLSWHGMLQVVRNKNIVKEIVSENVYEKDVIEFRFESGNRQIIHEFNPVTDRGLYMGTYSYSINTDGFIYHLSWVDEAEMAFISKRSKSSAWIHFASEMKKKVATRRLIKYINIEHISDDLLDTKIDLDE